MASTTNATNNTMVSNTSTPTITTTNRSFTEFKKCLQLVSAKNTKKPVPPNNLPMTGPHYNKNFVVFFGSNL